MSVVTLIIILGIIIAGAGVAIWLVLGGTKKSKDPNVREHDIEESVKQDVEHIFNDEFREELRNRGRLHFEKIIGENAMFLQQDLRLTTSQLNEYMKQEITRTLQEEFAKYEESIADAKKIAIESITKTQEVIEQQRQMMGQQLTTQIAAEKDNILSRFDKNMADIINHYVLSAIGNQIDLSDQLEYILNDLEANKKAIIEDVKNGA